MDTGGSGSLEAKQVTKMYVNEEMVVGILMMCSNIIIKHNGEVNNTREKWKYKLYHTSVVQFNLSSYGRKV